MRRAGRGWEEREMAAMTVSPRVHVLVVCDNIEATDEANVYNLLGVRTSIQANRFPHTRIPVGLCQATGHPEAPSATSQWRGDRRTMEWWTSWRER